jgi:hypothetical protein
MRKNSSPPRSYSTTFVALLALATIIVAASFGNLTFGAEANVASVPTLSTAGKRPPTKPHRGPDPWVRLTRPAGCSGAVIHASRRHGIWIATCRHCVGSGRGAGLQVHFFWNGYQSPPFTGRVVRSHPRYDCAICWLPAQRFAVLPGVVPLASPSEGPRVGQTVLAAGCYAGEPYTPGSSVPEPALRKLAITSIDADGYQFSLSGGAWGGHSGGAVVDANTGRLVGVLWATAGGRPGTGRITSVAAIWETLYNPRRQPLRGQAFFAVPDEIGAENETAIPAARRPEVVVYGGDRTVIRRQIRANHVLDEHINFDWEPGNPHHAVVQWRSPDGRWWKREGWPGAESLIYSLRATGVPTQCPGGGCRPPERQQLPLNPWQLPQQSPPATPEPPPATQPDLAPEIERLHDLVREQKEQIETLIDSTRDRATEVRDGIERIVGNVKDRVDTFVGTREQLQEDHETIAEALTGEKPQDGEAGDPLLPAEDRIYAIWALLAAILGAFGIKVWKQPPAPDAKDPNKP